MSSPPPRDKLRPPRPPCPSEPPPPHEKYLVEFIGTFFLVFTVGSTVIAPGIGALAPLAIGASLMVMVFAGGHVSGGQQLQPGGHFPGVWMRGACPTRDVIPYWLAQLAAAFVAAWLMQFFKVPGSAHVLPIGIKRRAAAPSSSSPTRSSGWC